MNTFRLSFCLLLLLAQTAVAPQVQAQSGSCPPDEPTACSTYDYEVIGISMILTPLGQTVWTYSATILDYTVQLYYDAAGTARLYSNEGHLITSGSFGADGSLNASNVYSGYNLITEHDLIPTVPDYDSDFNYEGYLDPLGFGTLGQASSGGDYIDVVGDPNNYYENGAYPDVSGQIDIGSSSCNVAAAPPILSSITETIGGLSSVPNVVLNGSGALNILGAYLDDQGADPNPAVCVNGVCASGANRATSAGLSLSNVALVGTDGKEITVNYTVDGQASSVGTHQITVTTVAGSSNQLGLTVGDPTPVITGVTPAAPPDWQAANSPLLVTVTGTGFGTAPQLSITGSAVAGVTGVTNQPASGPVTSISATVALYSYGGSAVITVTSTGYGGAGGASFLPSSSGDSATSAPWDVAVDPAPPPVPIIVWGQGQSACQAGVTVPSTVVIGQQIAFTACFQIPAGATVATETWTPQLPLGTAVAGFNVTYTGTGATLLAQAASSQPLSNTICGTGPFCTYGPFYWVDQGNPRTFTFSYQLTDGSKNSASLSFNVTGPTNAAMTANPQNAVIVRQGTNGALMSLGQTTPAAAAGIAFSVTPSPASLQQSLAGLIGPHGNYQFVQVVRSETITERTNQGVFACVPKALASSTPVDVNYPYPSNQISMTTADSPASGLSYSALGVGYSLYELRRDFLVTMYLMFDPGLPIGGDPDPCFPALASSPTQRAQTQCHGSIPVPLGSISWSYTGNSINTLNPNAPQGNGTSWVVAPNCGISAKQSGFVPGTAYPSWQTVNVNANRSLITFNCTPQGQ